MLKLLIPVDGSDASLRAIEAAARLARESTVEATLIHVREGLGTYHGDRSPREYERIAEHERDRQAKVLDEAVAKARGAGLQDVVAQAEAGTPDIDIPRVATQRGVDMIVMATRGLGAVGALLMGSTAQKVVHHSTVPVLLVK
ncbi:MAG: hypothetical protein RJA99_4662 [Pseudomonadota bacterium]|jgi:nucleotide-binding universal stress UspA family protein